MTTNQMSADAASSVFSASNAIPRTIGVLAGIAGAVLPVLTATGFGMTQSMTLWQAAALPALAGLALLSPAIGPMRAFGRMLDILALVAGILALAYVAYLSFDASRQIAAMRGFNTAGANIAIAPGLGLWAVIVATISMGVAILFGRRS